MENLDSIVFIKGVPVFKEKTMKGCFFGSLHVLSIYMLNEKFRRDLEEECLKRLGIEKFEGFFIPTLTNKEIVDYTESQQINGTSLFLQTKIKNFEKYKKEKDSINSILSLLNLENTIMTFDIELTRKLLTSGKYSAIYAARSGMFSDKRITTGTAKYHFSPIIEIKESAFSITNVAKGRYYELPLIEGINFKTTIINGKTKKVFLDSVYLIKTTDLRKSVKLLNK